MADEAKVVARGAREGESDADGDKQHEQREDDDRFGEATRAFSGLRSIDDCDKREVLKGRTKRPHREHHATTFALGEARRPLRKLAELGRAERCHTVSGSHLPRAVEQQVPRARSGAHLRQQRRSSIGGHGGEPRSHRGGEGLAPHDGSSVACGLQIARSKKADEQRGRERNDGDEQRREGHEGPASTTFSAGRSRLCFRRVAHQRHFHSGSRMENVA